MFLNFFHFVHCAGIHAGLLCPSKRKCSKYSHANGNNITQWCFTISVWWHEQGCKAGAQISELWWAIYLVTKNSCYDSLKIAMMSVGDVDALWNMTHLQSNHIMKIHKCIQAKLWENFSRWIVSELTLNSFPSWIPKYTVRFLPEHLHIP